MARLLASAGARRYAQQQVARQSLTGLPLCHASCPSVCTHPRGADSARPHRAPRHRDTLLEWHHAAWRQHVLPIQTPLATTTAACAFDPRCQSRPSTRKHQAETAPALHPSTARRHHPPVHAMPVLPALRRKQPQPLCAWRTSRAQVNRERVRQTTRLVLRRSLPCSGLPASCLVCHDPPMSPQSKRLCTVLYGAHHVMPYGTS